MPGQSAGDGFCCCVLTIEHRYEKLEYIFIFTRDVQWIKGKEVNHKILLLESPATWTITGLNL